MKCPKCGYEPLRQDLVKCPMCGVSLTLREPWKIRAKGPFLKALD